MRESSLGSYWLFLDILPDERDVRKYPEAGDKVAFHARPVMMGVQAAKRVTIQAADAFKIFRGDVMYVIQYIGDGVCLVQKGVNITGFFKFAYQFTVVAAMGIYFFFFHGFIF